MDISINMNRDTNDNLCRHLVEIEKLSPSTTSILHTKASSQRSRQAWEITLMVAPRTKGCRLKYIRMGHNSTIVSLISKIIPPLMLHSSSIYRPSIGSEGLKRSVSQHMEGEGTVLHYFVGENSNFSF